MVPAISENSQERGVFTVLGTFTGTIGWNGLTIIVVPITTYFTYLATGKHEQGNAGWLAFAIIISLLAVLCALATTWGTKEKNNIIRDSANKEKTSIKDVFVGIAKNDQMLWTSLAYLSVFSCLMLRLTVFCSITLNLCLISQTNSGLLGVVATIVSFFTAPLYGILNKFIPRKVLYSDWANRYDLLLRYLLNST